MSKRNVTKAASRDLFAKLDDEPKTRNKKAVKAVPSRARGGSAEDAYTAADIEVLEGLEPVRRRPGMYIGGTDEKAMHHLSPRCWITPWTRRWQGMRAASRSISTPTAI